MPRHLNIILGISLAKIQLILKSRCTLDQSPRERRASEEASEESEEGQLRTAFLISGTFDLLPSTSSFDYTCRHIKWYDVINLTKLDRFCCQFCHDIRFLNLDNSVIGKDTKERLVAIFSFFPVQTTKIFIS